MRVAAVGECTIDRYPGRGEVRAGGISLNFAVHARRAGATMAALVSCTGDDEAGRLVRAAVAHEGVDATHLHARRGRTASQRIELSAGGERAFPAGGYDEGVLAEFRVDAAALDMLRTVDVIAIPVFRQLEPLVAPVIALRGVPALRVADLLDGADLGHDLQAIDQLLDALDVLFLSGGEELVDYLLPRSRGARSLLVITHGARGSTALHGGRSTHTPATPVPPAECVDSTGCGDAYQAAFSVHYARDRDIAAAMRAGAARAARVIRHLGAFADER
ncbi:MAG TPA: PfkB family carbohydrate kinase [Gemmatimonadaceae bacterium]|nr:PfkB family carbohydrate kinase [Gemmatimonadaceae bacterium]